MQDFEPFEITVRHHQKRPKLSDEEKEEELILLIDNIDVLLENKEEIFSDDNLFFCALSCGYIGDYLTGSHVLPIGVLVKLWESGNFLETCPYCGEKVYILGVSGSLLSGANSYNGFCPLCRKEITGSARSFGNLFRAARSKTRANYEEIKKIKKQHFTWGEGLVGEDSEPEVVRELIEGVSLKELIDYLK